MSKSHIEASYRYNRKNYERLSVNVRKGQREQISEYAKSKGLSLNAYVIGLISTDMGDKLTGNCSEDTCHLPE